MNKIIDIRVDTINHQKPIICCLFDSLDFDEMIFEPRRIFQRNKKSILLNTIDVTGYNLTAISGDAVQWYYVSGPNRNGPHKNLFLKIKEKDSYSVQFFDGIWSNNAEAINLWFPENHVMSIIGTYENDFYSLKGIKMGAVSSSVIKILKEIGWQVGLVRNADGYTDVEPLIQPSDEPKNGKIIRVL